jgi:hypothetical protein
MTLIDVQLEVACRKIWNLPKSYPRAALLVPHNKLGITIPTIWEDYCSSAIRSWIHVLNDKGALGASTRATLHDSSTEFKHWSLELAFANQRNGTFFVPFRYISQHRIPAYGQHALMGTPLVEHPDVFHLHVSRPHLIPSDDDG